MLAPVAGGMPTLAIVTGSAGIGLSGVPEFAISKARDDTRSGRLDASHPETVAPAEAPMRWAFLILA